MSGTSVERRSVAPRQVPEDALAWLCAQNAAAERTATPAQGSKTPSSGVCSEMVCWAVPHQGARNPSAPPSGQTATFDAIPHQRTQEPCGRTQLIVSPDGMGKCDSGVRMASALTYTAPSICRAARTRYPSADSPGKRSGQSSPAYRGASAHRS